MLLASKTFSASDVLPESRYSVICSRCVQGDGAEEFQAARSALCKAGRTKHNIRKRKVASELVERMGSAFVNAGLGRRVGSGGAVRCGEVGGGADGRVGAWGVRIKDTNQ